jgi:hypothetical protein
MADHTLLQPSSDGLGMPWSWCEHCQRAYVTGTCRLIWFAPNALNPHPPKLKLCPYDDCDANTTRHGWHWATVRVQHPEYPVTPKRNVVYVR